MKLHPLPPAATGIEPPERFTYPFCYEPHPLCIAVAREVRAYLDTQPQWTSEIAAGKMMGVLVVEHQGQRGFLAAFSGTLGQQTQQEYFVPPVFDLMAPGSYFLSEEKAISSINRLVKKLRDTDPATVKTLEEERRRRSQALQEWLFLQYTFLNAEGQSRSLREIFHPATPPSGAGDCCAPKLLQYAYANGMQPLCMAEFWLGRSPKDELRREGQYYPACRSKCLPILSHMLVGLRVDENPLSKGHEALEARLKIVFQGEDIVVVSKPSGMLSVPGKEDLPNVQNSMKSRFSEATGPMIVHRLDMDTSGLMVLALTDERYHQLQEMFLKHQVEKTYIALLEHPMTVGQEGEIRLPLRPDIDDRPRQMVDPVHGRTAVTLYRVVGEKDGHALVELRPQTGRTHQLRVHCAHPRGLDNPIVGDRLYGTAGPRLMLHAARLRFDSYDFTDNDECFAL